MLRSLQNYMYGKKSYQHFFEKLYHFSKFGRNIGLPVDVNTSGEVYFIQLLAKKFRNENEVIFFDVGANHGIYTKHVLKFFPAATQCYLFEPQEGLCKELHTTFGNAGNVTIIEKGCGSKTERVNLYSFKDIDTLASLYNAFKEEGPGSFKAINVVRLDEFIHEHSIPYIHFVKMDVEGHEPEVLKGLGKYLAERKINVIQFEFGVFNIASRSFFKDLWELLHKEYNIFRILKDGLKEIKSYSPDLEIFATTNYAAILKR